MQIPNYSEIEALPVTEKVAVGLNMARLQNRAYSTLGKVYLLLDEQFDREDSGKPRAERRYVTPTLAKVGVHEKTAGNASYAARMWRDLVRPGHITEAEYDKLSFGLCYAAAMVMSAKDNKRVLAAVEVADWILRNPDEAEQDFVSLRKDGITAAEAAIAKQKADAEKIAADLAAAVAKEIAAQPKAATAVQPTAPVIPPTPAPAPTPTPTPPVNDALARVRAENAALIAAQSAPVPVSEPEPIVTESPVAPPEPTPTATESPVAAPEPPAIVPAPPKAVTEPTPFTAPDRTPEVLAGIERLELAIASLSADGQMAAWEKLTGLMGRLVNSLEASEVAA